MSKKATDSLDALLSGGRKPSRVCETCQNATWVATVARWIELPDRCSRRELHRVMREHRAYTLGYSALNNHLLNCLKFSG